MDEDSDKRLDIVSGEDPVTQAASDSPYPRKRRENGKPPTLRVLFGCCNVYARIPIPRRVQSGELTRWRVYCTRCGRAVELE